MYPYDESIVSISKQKLHDMERHINKMDKMLDEISKMIMVWWSDHEFDEINGRNVYSEDPDFVVMAKKHIQGKID